MKLCKLYLKNWKRLEWLDCKSETGSGDYTREKWLGDATVGDLIEEIRGKKEDR